MYALVIGCVLNKEFINFTTGEILQVHKLHVAAVAVPSRSSKLRFFVSSNASCSAWHCHKSDCKCTEALHGKAHGSGNARLSKPRKNKGNWNWQAVAAIDWAMKRRAAESERLSQTRGLQRLLQTWKMNIRTQPKHPMSCTWRDDTSDCNFSYACRNRVPNLERPRAYRKLQLKPLRLQGFFWYDIFQSLHSVIIFLDHLRKEPWRLLACAAAAGSPGSVVAVLRRMDQWVWDTASLMPLLWITAFDVCTIWGTEVKQ